MLSSRDCGCQKVVLKGMRRPWGRLPRGTSQRRPAVALGHAYEGGAHTLRRSFVPPRYLVALPKRAAAAAAAAAGLRNAGTAGMRMSSPPRRVTRSRLHLDPCPPS